MADADEPAPPSITVIGEPAKRNKGGRPRVEIPGTKIAMWLPTPVADRLIRVALRHDRTVSSVVRDLILQRLDRVDPL